MYRGIFSEISSALSDTLKAGVFPLIAGTFMAMCSLHLFHEDELTVDMFLNSLFKVPLLSVLVYECSSL